MIPIRRRSFAAASIHLQLDTIGKIMRSSMSPSSDLQRNIRVDKHPKSQMSQTT
jgi:hypothetical protein